ncbi:FtsW/RodA/SpoVE family cell cycle protein [Vagococcus elongatus]|uniref:Rod shape-determining protein RodA n=1 Tax=Vagococcus elongatus TaxID=180344 RepID=A0A430AQF7_9ENTE|nr:FtsW/RodA/SpoVE family cell cycle protein [Vagococcus elongatus]RSU10295.1 rod shape-determining protein RodA [Vagococcus elongatus]
MNKKTISLDNRIDYGIILPVFVLCLVGLVAQYVALSVNPIKQDVTAQMFKNVLWLAIGVVAIAVLMQFTSKLWWKLSVLFYGLGLVLMVLPLYFSDPRVVALTGSKNWVYLGGLSFQPSELMKIAYILILAFIVTRHNLQEEHTTKQDFILIGKMVAVTIPIAVLLRFQHDFGTLLVFFAIFCGVFLMSGISWKILLPSIGLAILLVVGVIYAVTTETGREFLQGLGVKQYQLLRIDSWQNPFHDPTGNSYQQAQALTAIGSGGLVGKGFNVSEVEIPVRESDMIFTVIAENFGFIGSVFVIFMYFLLIYRMIRVCFDTNNEFYTYIATGIIMMILFHVFENIGANIGLLPLTGIPLPFISQGGSALLGNMIGIGIILSMRFQQEDYLTA